MYSYLYSFIQKLILKKSLNSDAASLLKLLKVKNVIDIGCGDSDVLNYYKFEKNQKYFGYEAEGYFINKLKSIEDTDGKNVLENSMIVYGCGIADGNSHAHHDLPIILAGHGGGKLNAGRHLDFQGEVPLSSALRREARIPPEDTQGGRHLKTVYVWCVDAR